MHKPLTLTTLIDCILLIPKAMGGWGFYHAGCPLQPSLDWKKQPSGTLLGPFISSRSSGVS